MKCYLSNIYYKFIKYIVIVPIILLVSTTAVFPEEVTLGEFDIKITHPRKCEELAQFTDRVIREIVAELPSFFIPQDGELRFIIVDSEDEFERYVGQSIPKWASGVTIFPAGVIVVKSTNLVKSTLRDYKETVAHELIHGLQGNIVPLNLTPVWFNEGLAVYFTKEYNLRDKVILSRAIMKNRLIPLDRLSNVLEFNHQKAELAYAESASVIEFLVNVYGAEIIGEIFKKMQTGYGFMKSIELITGIEYSRFESLWKDYTSSSYKFLFLLDIQYILWLIIPLLVIFAYFAKRLRNKRIVDNWELEELSNEQLQEQQNNT